MTCCVCYEEDYIFKCDTCQEGKICFDCFHEMESEFQRDITNRPRDKLLPLLKCLCCRTINWKWLYSEIIKDIVLKNPEQLWHYHDKFHQKMKTPQHIEEMIEWSTHAVYCKRIPIPIL